ncbi:MAG TPA: hypothetical protein DDZ51_25080 [Planctomycetaceae bacterium]|nr:hypothetical protein [Planctomycetaceae bacterium]
MDPTFDLFDRLDHHWRTHSDDDIEAILRTAADRCEPIDVKVDLCAADLEWRLRTNTDSLTPISRQVANHPRTPARATDYQKLLGKDWESTAVRQELLEAEWIARSRFGDRPAVDEFARQIPGNEAWCDELGKLLDLIAPLRLTVQDGHDVVMEGRVPAQFIIGRGNRHEPDAPAWNAKENRVIVANANFRSLSRMQLSVRRVRVEEIELANVSRLIPTKLENSTLYPGQTIRSELPLNLFFTHFRLTIGCETDIDFSLDSAKQTD